MPMIESVEGLKNLDAIAGSPGVGALFLGQGSDLSRSLGVRPGAPEVEAAFQQVLKACKAHKIGCAISANTPDQVAKRVKEGWNIIRSTVPLNRQDAPPRREVAPRARLLSADLEGAVLFLTLPRSSDGTVGRPRLSILPSTTYATRFPARSLPSASKRTTEPAGLSVAF